MYFNILRFSQVIVVNAEQLLLPKLKKCYVCDDKVGMRLNSAMETAKVHIQNYIQDNFK